MAIQVVIAAILSVLKVPRLESGPANNRSVGTHNLKRDTIYRINKSESVLSSFDAAVHSEMTAFEVT
jgi:hypothetical protein